LNIYCLNILIVFYYVAIIFLFLHQIRQQSISLHQGLGSEATLCDYKEAWAFKPPHIIVAEAWAIATSGSFVAFYSNVIHLILILMIR
jgi:hypothetical protein